MFRRLTIKAKLALAFAMFLAVAGVMGIVGIVGLRLMSAQLSDIATVELPNSRHASELAQATGALELSFVAYLLGNEIDKTSEQGIAAAKGRVSALLMNPELLVLEPKFRHLAAEIERALLAHRNSSALYFRFEGREFSLADFFNMIAVQNAAYLKRLGDATRFGVFENVAVDPTATTFARWRPGFDTQDAELQGLLADFAKAETNAVVYVREKVIVNPERAQQQFIRLNTRRIPKQDRALNALISIATDRVSTLWAVKKTALDEVRAELGAFIGEAQILEQAAMQGMQSSVVRANRNGANAMLVSIVVFLAGIGITLGATLFATRHIGRPLNDLAERLADLAADRFDISIPHLARKDEIGRIALATEAFRESGRQRARLEESQEENRLNEQIRMDAQAREAEMLAAFQQELRGVVTTARNGDFNARVSDDHADEGLMEFSSQMNNLMNVVGDGIGKTSGVLSAFARGDLSARIAGRFSGIFAALKHDVNATGEKLSELVASIKSSAQGINDAVETIVGGANSLSGRTAKQATVLEDTSCAVSEVAVSVSENAENARLAKALSGETTEVAKRGKDIAAKAVAAIRLVKDSAEQISKINSMVDDLSLQTNLLALNASVEAARAGDAGNGFAVVAQEVRVLAQKSKAAADKIAQLITETHGRVTAGVEMVEATGTSLSEIHEYIGSLEQAIEEMSSACTTQSEQVTEISGVFSRLDRETRENASLAGVSKDTAGNLARRAEELLELVSFFDTAASGTPTVPEQSTVRQSTDPGAVAA